MWQNCQSSHCKNESHYASVHSICTQLGNGPGQCKICKRPTPRTDMAGKCPEVARGGGGGGGGGAQVELTDALSPSFVKLEIK